MHNGRGETVIARRGSVMTLKSFDKSGFANMKAYGVEFRCRGKDTVRYGDANLWIHTRHLQVIP
jgi:hypothetical protein